MEERGTLVVAGQGYAGLALSTRAAQSAWRVVGIAADAQSAARLAAGEPDADGVADEDLRAALDSGRYTPTADYALARGFDVAVVTVPPAARGTPGPSPVLGAGRELARHLRPGATVILETTCPPGTTETVLAPVLEAGSGLAAGRDFRLGYSPERIDPGNRAYSLVNTPKVVSGVDDASLAAVRAFYETLGVRAVDVSSTRTAELTKVLEATFRQVNIALVNEIATVAGRLGADVFEAVEAASTSPFGYAAFRPGPGVGGQCPPIGPDGSGLAFARLADEVNASMPQHVVRRVGEVLATRGLPVRGSRLLLLGLSYKRNASGVQNSPALRVAGLLSEAGAMVRAADPHVDPVSVTAPVRVVDLDEAEVAAADLVVVLVDHDLFPRGLVARFARAVLDTRGWLPAAAGVPVPRRAPDAESLIVPAHTPRVESL